MFIQQESIGGTTTAPCQNYVTDWQVTVFNKQWCLGSRASRCSASACWRCVPHLHASALLMQQ
jgi:hypothetical protein